MSGFGYEAAMNEYAEMMEMYGAPPPTPLPEPTGPTEFVVVVIDVLGKIVVHATDDEGYVEQFTTHCEIERSWLCAMKVVTKDVVWDRCERCYPPKPV